MRNLRDFCKVVDNALDVRVCDHIIEYYNNNIQYHERFDNNKKPNFTQLNLTSHQNFAPEIHDYLVQMSLYQLDQYKKEIPETEYWPEKVVFEEFRIKHYDGNSYDQFDMHVDSISLTTAKRYFAFFWYLNDVEEGGETEFPQLDLIVKPQKGRMFMFPPLWQYPHKGNPVVKGEKFLLSSYLHYGE